MSISFDVIFVGAGPASLAGAIRLRHLAKMHPGFKDLKVAVIEKAPNLGDQSLSGATFDPRALGTLIPNFMEQMPPFGPTVKKERLVFLTKNLSFASPFVPPPMSNKGKRLVALSDLTKWLGKIAESEGVEIYTGEPVDELLISNGSVIGVRIKEKGIDKSGARKPNYLPSTDVGAKVVVLGEGARGHLTKRLIKEFHLDKGATPQGYAVGLKELWEVHEDKFLPGFICNMLGYPVPLSTFGGGFVYHVKDRMVTVGLVVGLDWKDPRLHPFKLLQMLKRHPYVAKMLDGGRFVSYGAKTIAEGGLFAMPRAFGNGFLIIGESGGILDSFRLKGIDPAIQSGIFAADTIFDALSKNDFSETALSSYSSKLRKSWIGKDLWRARNFHQGYHRGLIPGMFHTALQFISGGRGLVSRFKVPEDYLCMRKLKPHEKSSEAELSPDGKTIFDKLTCVYGSGTKHEEDQPSHIKIDDISICNGRCKEEYGNPCQYFCPANVFEMVKEDDGVARLHLNPANCLHCKTCDIKDPYGIVTWVPPEGGGGPNYKGM